MSFHGNQPRVFWKGEYLAICGDSFWNNNHGASLFCKKLGHSSGTISVTSGDSTSLYRALYIGECSNTDGDLTSCSGGYNRYNIVPLKDCMGSNAGYKIECSGGSDVPETSCKLPGVE